MSGDDAKQNYAFKSVEPSFELVRELTGAHREQYYQNSGRQLSDKEFILLLLIMNNRSGGFDRNG